MIINVAMFGIVAAVASLVLFLLWLSARLSLPEWCAAPMALAALVTWAAMLVEIGAVFLVQ